MLRNGKVNIWIKITKNSKACLKEHKFLLKLTNVLTVTINDFVKN